MSSARHTLPRWKDSTLAGLESSLGGRYDIYQAQGLFSEPDSSTRDGDTRMMIFTASPGDTFVVSFDGHSYRSPAVS